MKKENQTFLNFAGNFWEKTRALFRAARIKTLGVSLSPVMLGSAFAYNEGSFRLLPGVIATVTALFIQILTNYVNDYFDFIKGADDANRLGPKRAMQMGWLSKTEMKAAIYTVTGICLLLGGYLTYLTDFYIFVIGIVSLFCAYIYTAGPYPLAYNGMGELFVFLFFGPVAVMGSYYCHTLMFNHEVLLAAVAVGMLSTMVLMVNNMRDIATDTLANKFTMAVFLGAKRYRLLYVALGIMGTFSPLGYMAIKGKSIAIYLVILPGLIYSARVMYQFENPRELNSVLGLNTLCLICFCVLFSASLILFKDAV